MADGRALVGLALLAFVGGRVLSRPAGSRIRTGFPRVPGIPPAKVSEWESVGSNSCRRARLPSGAWEVYAIAASVARDRRVVDRPFLALFEDASVFELSYLGPEGTRVKRSVDANYFATAQAAVDAVVRYELAQMKAGSGIQTGLRTSRYPDLPPEYRNEWTKTEPSTPSGRTRLEVQTNAGFYSIRYTERAKDILVLVRPAGADVEKYLYVDGTLHAAAVKAESIHTAYHFSVRDAIDAARDHAVKFVLAKSATEKP